MKSYKQVFDMNANYRNPEHGYDSSYHLLKELPFILVKTKPDSTFLILQLYLLYNLI